MSSELMTVLISALFSILVAAFTSWVGSAVYLQQARIDLQKEYESRFNNRKWETYMGFSAIVADLLRNNKSGSQDQKKITSDLTKFAGDLWVVGSDRVIDAFTKYLQTGRADSLDAMQLLTSVTQIIVEMRRDLGYVNDHVTARDLLATFINDLPPQINA